MPILSEPVKAMRITQSARALALWNTGISKKEACDQAGISVDVLDHWLAEESEAIQAIRDVTIENERKALAAVIATRTTILLKLNEIIATIPLPAKDLVLVDEHLSKVQSELQTKYGTQAVDAEAQEYLKLAGPNLARVDSIFAAKVTVELGSIKAEPSSNDVLDAEFSEEKLLP